ncbi:thiamine diphosphokinase [Pseudomonadota bacterium]
MIKIKTSLVYIVCNGVFNDKSFYKDLFRNTTKGTIIVGVDGGNNFLNSINVKPNYVVGDFDSIDKGILSFYKSDKQIKVVYKNSQDITDLQLAIKVVNELKPRKVVILGAISDRFDHTLSNAITLDEINENVDAVIINESNEVRLVKNKINISGKVGDTVSILPVTDIKGLTYKGLKWLVEDLDVKTGWLGVSNEFVKERIEISLKKGKIFVITQSNKSSL